MESEFPGNRHLCTLCLKCLQSLTKFHAVALTNFVAWGLNIPFDVGEFEHCEHYLTL